MFYLNVNKLFLEVQFKYEDFGPLSPKTTKADDSKTFTVNRPARNKRLESDKEEQNWTDNETTPLAESCQPPTHRYNNPRYQHTYSDHRASIASAPPSTTRSGSISTITGVPIHLTILYNHFGKLLQQARPICNPLPPTTPSTTTTPTRSNYRTFNRIIKLTINNYR